MATITLLAMKIILSLEDNETIKLTYEVGEATDEKQLDFLAAAWKILDIEYRVLKAVATDKGEV